MPTIETQVGIKAPAVRVWEVLTDFPAMSAWNPFIRSISGSPAPGQRLRALIAPPGQAAMTFEPMVLIADAPKELRWRGTLMGAWMFAGEHYFVLHSEGDGTTRFTHGERFSGLLAPLIMRGQVQAATQQGFVIMNEALKRRAEGLG